MSVRSSALQHTALFKNAACPTFYQPVLWAEPIELAVDENKLYSFDQSWVISLF